MRRIRSLLVGLAVVATAAACGSDSDDNETPSAFLPSSALTTTAPAAGSVAGRVCVSMSDPAPAGAPSVPVREGPPPSQLVAQDLSPGTGAPVEAGATVTVHYIGVACSTGRIFDSSYAGTNPATFRLTGVIRGWQDGIPGMKVGGRRLLGVPPDQAYGSQGRPPAIAPGETLWFVVEVLATSPNG